MYGKTKNGEGVLNNFDLAHMRGKTRPSGTERTGTMPFMALDLLTEGAWAGRVKRLYRHDCESFAWVLLWICSRYDNGAEIEDPPFNQFITSGFEQCRAMKLDCRTTIIKIKPAASCEAFWCAAVRLVIHVLNQLSATEDAILCGKPRHEPTFDEVVRDCQDVLKKIGSDIEL